MSLPRPTIILFDMDGTTVRHINPALISTLERLDDLFYTVSRFFSKHKEIVDTSEEPTDLRGVLVHRALHKLRRKPVDQIVQPCPGIYLLLNFFQFHKIPMGIVSNGLGKGYGHDILTKFKLDKYFQVQVFREDIQVSKPHPDPILRALKGFDREVTSDDVIWYIGDRHKDVEAAIVANTLSDAQIIPIAYNLNAAMAALKKNIGNDHITMSYYDFFTRIKNQVFTD